MSRKAKPETIERKLEEAFETDFSDEKAVLALIKKIFRATLNKSGRMRPSLDGDEKSVGPWIIGCGFGEEDRTLEAILAIEDEERRLHLLEKYYALAQRLGQAFKEMQDKIPENKRRERELFSQNSIATLWGHIRYLDGLLVLVKLNLDRNFPVGADARMYSVTMAFCFHFYRETGYLTDRRVDNLLTFLDGYPTPEREDKRFKYGHQIFSVPEIYLRLKKQIPEKWGAITQVYIERLQEKINLGEEKIRIEKEKIQTLKGDIRELEHLLSPDS